MTLSQLLKGTTIEGSVRLSAWKDDEEVVSRYFEGPELNHDIKAYARGFLSCPVKYLFCAGECMVIEIGIAE